MPEAGIADLESFETDIDGWRWFSSGARDVSNSREVSLGLNGSRNCTGEVGAVSGELIPVEDSLFVIEFARRRAGIVPVDGRIRRSPCSFGLVAVDSLRASLSDAPS